MLMHGVYTHNNKIWDSEWDTSVFFFWGGGGVGSKKFKMKPGLPKQS